MQNKLLKYVMRFDMRTGTNLLHTTLDIMKVEDIQKNNVLTFVNMCLMGKCPEIFNQYYRVKTTPHETRQEGSLDMPSHRIEYGARSVKVVGVKLWNKLEKYLENINSNRALNGKLEEVKYLNTWVTHQRIESMPINISWYNYPNHVNACYRSYRCRYSGLVGGESHLVQ